MRSGTQTCTWQVELGAVSCSDVNECRLDTNDDAPARGSELLLQMRRRQLQQGRWVRSFGDDDDGGDDDEDDRVQDRDA